MKKFGKRFLALTLAGVMACSPVALAANANDGTGIGDTNSITGTGAVEGAVNKDIVKVILPTAPEATSILKFTLDPQSLINGSLASDSAKDEYKNVTFEEGATVFFANKNAEGTVTGYSSTSDALKVINKGTQAVEVSFQGQLTDLGTSDAEIKVSTTDDFSDSAVKDVPSIYLAVDDGTKTALSATKAPVTSFDLGAAPDEAYEVKYDSDSDSYSYAIKSGVEDDTFDSASFTVTGAANSSQKADWTKAAATTPTISLTWTIAASTSEKAVFTPDDSTPGVLSYTAGAGKATLASIDSIVVTYAGVDYEVFKTLDGFWNAATVNSGSKTVTLDTGVMNTFSSLGESFDAVITYKNTDGKAYKTNATIKMK